MMMMMMLGAASAVQKSISETFASLRSQVRSESLVFTVSDSSVVIWPNQELYSPPGEISSQTPCEEVHRWIKSDEQDSGKKASNKKIKKLVTEDPADGPRPARLPPRGLACNRLLEALERQLSEMETTALRCMEGTTLVVPEPHHFLLPEPRGLVTVLLPAGVPDSQLQGQRKELHARFDLPEDRPYFRRAAAYCFPDHVHKDGYLRNPHRVLAHPSLDNGKVFLVQGVYSYHHYMQDRMDDNGWGCAYRSLQTLSSWFLQQGYVEQRPVPSHKEIQQPTAFAGSRKWIGSIEVQAVLDQLLGVTSKIMFVSQGCDLGSKGRELANHFLTEGTPIMIGGGVLAHTILGVAWSETTGQIRYLILDPHYTGAEDLQVITDKGWCGWKVRT
ncbi:hypothetical protein CRUP_007468, partial [Coryphaenoides rupestris]